MTTPERIGTTKLEIYRNYRAQGLSYKAIARLENVSHLHIKTWLHRENKLDNLQRGKP
jgi:transposase